MDSVGIASARGGAASSQERGEAGKEETLLSNVSCIRDGFDQRGLKPLGIIC